MPSRGKTVSKIKYSAIDALSASVEQFPALVKSMPEEASGIQVISRMYPRLRFLKEERNYNYSDLSDFLKDKLGLDLSPETVRGYMSLVKKDQPAAKRKLTRSSPIEPSTLPIADPVPIVESPVIPAPIPIVEPIVSVDPVPIAIPIVSVDPVPIVESSDALVREPGESDRSWVQRRLKAKRAQQGIALDEPVHSEEHPIDPYDQRLDESYGQWQVRIRQLDQDKRLSGRTVLGSPRSNQAETDKLFHQY
jgi:hypothetical protein